MSTSYQVDPNAIRTAATNILNSANQIESEINRLTAAVNNLHTSWKGKAASSFDGVYQEWKAVTPKMIRALDDLEAAAKKIAQNYDDAELANTIK